MRFVLGLRMLGFAVLGRSLLISYGLRLILFFGLMFKGLCPFLCIFKIQSFEK